MTRPANRAPRTSALVADKLFNALERFLHVEAVSGVVLLVAAAIALIWANSPAGDSYTHFWHTPVSFGFGEHVVSQSLHFWINDGLMTIFFLVVGLEIRREIYEGALSTLQLAALPLIAATGGVIAPAIIYSLMNTEPVVHAGWAIPTATDIAFAVGVLALLGKAVPSPVRILLLSLAVIDDIAAIIIIALFYSGGVDPSGLWVAGLGVLLVLGFQRLGINSAFAYLIPGLVLWLGFLKLGVHPTLAGVVLGLLTPAKVFSIRERPTEWVASVLQEFGERVRSAGIDTDARVLVEPAKQLQRAQRDIVPPVIRVQAALHPWVAYGIMPLFALANAGVTLNSFTFDPSSQTVLLGVGLGLLLGKPLGIFLVTFAAVRMGLCRLSLGLTWPGVLLVGFLGGIGFTMSIFIANLAFTSESLLGAAKLGVLIASGCAAVVGLTYGKLTLGNSGAAQR